MSLEFVYGKTEHTGQSLHFFRLILLLYFLLTEGKRLKIHNHPNIYVK